MRHFFRGATIIWIALRYGLDELVLTSLQKPWLLRVARVLTIGRKLDAPRGQRLREALEQLGPIFVKFGQVLSTRRDLLPPDIANELMYLQDRVPPFDPAVAVATIERAFQKPVDQVFVHFEREPVASASIAQVHFATIRDREGGLREVAVKVLRPGMKDVIEKDLELMRMMAGWVEKLSADGKRLKPRQVVAEFDNYLHDELDLVKEAANAAQLRRNMDGLDLVLIPEMFWDYCHADVLVMERMRGVPISQVERLREAGVDIPRLARDGVTIFFTQVFRDGFFHADMHPGNIFVSTVNPWSPQYIAIDCGIVGSLTPEDQDYLARNLFAFFKRDYRRVAQLHIDSGWVPAETKLNEFEAAIRTVCEPIFEKPLKDISFGQVLMRLFQTARRFNMEVQPQLVLLQKTLLNIEGLGRQLYPDLDLWNTAQPFLERWMRERMSPKTMLGNLHSQFEQLPHLANMTRDLLERMSQPHAKDPAPPWQKRKDDWFLRLLGAAHLVGGVMLAIGGPLNQLGHWPAGIMVAVGVYLIVRR